MSILELRGEIATIISKVEDEAVLAHIRDLLVEALGAFENDEPENLSPEQFNRLEALKKSARQPEHQVSDEEVVAMLKNR